MVLHAESARYVAATRDADQFPCFGLIGFGRLAVRSVAASQVVMACSQKLRSDGVGGAPGDVSNLNSFACEVQGRAVLGQIGFELGHRIIPENQMREVFRLQAEIQAKTVG